MITHSKLKEVIKNWDIEQPVTITDISLGGNLNIKADDTWNVINILTGYDSVSKLTPEEHKAAIYVVYSIQMICVAYFGKLDKFTELAGINRRMLKWIYESREKLVIA